MVKGGGRKFTVWEPQNWEKKKVAGHLKIFQPWAENHLYLKFLDSQSNNRRQPRKAYFYPGLNRSLTHSSWAKEFNLGLLAICGQSIRLKLFPLVAWDLLFQPEILGYYGYPQGIPCHEKQLKSLLVPLVLRILLPTEKYQVAEGHLLEDVVRASAVAQEAPSSFWAWAFSNLWRHTWAAKWHRQRRFHKKPRSKQQSLIHKKWLSSSKKCPAWEMLFSTSHGTPFFTHRYCLNWQQEESCHNKSPRLGNLLFLWPRDLLLIPRGTSLSLLANHLWLPKAAISGDQ